MHALTAQPRHHRAVTPESWVAPRVEHPLAGSHAGGRTHAAPRSRWSPKNR